MSNAPIEDSGTTTLQDDIDLLSQGETEVEVKPPAPVKPLPKEEPPEPEEEEEEEEKPEKEEEEKPPEGEEELPTSPYDRPSIKDLTAKYPDLFKNFPQMKDVIFREREFTNLFPTVDEAKEAAENATAFVTFREDVFEGDGSKFLSAIKEADDANFRKFATNVLPSIYKLSQEAYYTATAPVMQNLVRYIYSEGERTRDDNLKNTALVLSDLLFRDKDGEIATGKKSIIPEKPESKENKEVEDIKKEREKLNFERYVQPTLDKGFEGLNKEIDNDKLDPDKELTPWMKQVLVERIANGVTEVLKADADYMRYIDTLWVRYRQNGYKLEDQQKIVSAYLARVKKAVPSVRSKLVSEALGRASATAREKQEKVERVRQRREPDTSGRAGGGGSNKTYDPKSIDWGRTSDADLLDGRPTLRKR